MTCYKKELRFTRNSWHISIPLPLNLSALQDSGVVVLWRPYHEMNGGWFWWGGKTNFADLWKIMYNRYTSHHKLNNLIWVWSPNISFGNPSMDVINYYPGDDYVDIIGLDGYNNLKNWDEDIEDKEDLNQITTIAGNRPVALTEVGTLPDPEWLKNQRPNVAWFLCWWTHIEENGDSYIKEVYQHPYVLTREETPNFSRDAKDVFRIKNEIVHAWNSSIKHYENALEDHTDKTRFPSHTDNLGNLKTVDASNWVSGFFPGCLWQIYEYTGSSRIKTAAEDWTAGLESQQYNDQTHDLGFMMYCSYGNGFRLTANSQYKEILSTTARTLASRYNENVGCIRSWDWGSWEFPVIIDNMMNLELLTWAGKENQEDSLVNIAKTTRILPCKTTFGKIMAAITWWIIAWKLGKF
jgi:hypothetical protein